MYFQIEDYQVKSNNLQQYVHSCVLLEELATCSVLSRPKLSLHIKAL
jgi:hypothetical protein